jgi:hypothetical protein
MRRALDSLRVPPVPTLSAIHDPADNGRNVPKTKPAMPVLQLGYRSAGGVEEEEDMQREPPFAFVGREYVKSSKYVTRVLGIIVLSEFWWCFAAFTQPTTPTTQPPPPNLPQTTHTRRRRVSRIGAQSCLGPPRRRVGASRPRIRAPNGSRSRASRPGRVPCHRGACSGPTLLATASTGPLECRAPYPPQPGLSTASPA